MKSDDLRSAEYINKIRGLAEIIRYVNKYASEHELIDLLEYINNELKKITED